MSEELLCHGDGDGALWEPGGEANEAAGVDELELLSISSIK